MIDPSLLRALICPATRKPMREATSQELHAINQAIAKGVARNRGGLAVTAAWPAALATEDGAWLYPIQDGFPIMLTSEAIAAPPR
jgi:uncharacterized protein YbaR (Trm112 family)